MNDDKINSVNSNSFEIDRTELEYFFRITNNKLLSQYTALLAIFNVLAKRYFENYTGIISINDPTKKIENINLLSLKMEEADDDAVFKDCILNVKTELHSALTGHRNSHGKPVEEYNRASNSPGICFIMQAPVAYNYNGLLLHAGITIESRLTIEAVYPDKHFDSYVIKHFMNSFKRCLIELSELIDKKTAEFELTVEADDITLLNKFNDTRINYPADKTLTDLFLDQVKKNPGNLATVFENRTLTYSQLQLKINQLSSFLSANHTIEKGQIIGVLLPKSDHSIIALFAIMKSGAVYLPVDVSYPVERINYILANSGVRLIITDSTTLHNLKLDIPSIDILSDEIYTPIVPDTFPGDVKPKDIAYLIYTSGSTGNPKGVLVEHSGAVNMVLAQARSFNITGNDRIVWFASVSFDASISEIMMALCAGATLLIPGENTAKEIAVFVDYIHQNKASVITFPPGYLNLLSPHDYGRFRCIITAGEPANAKKATEVVNHGIDYYNAYGPTEYSVCATIYKLPGDKNFNRNIPIGSPISNTRIYILDEKRHLLPIGVFGKIYLSGAGIARGYLNNPELTKEFFTANPFEENELMYCTGDVGRWLPDGNIEFGGRKDHQVKIRGYRVELAEIENTLFRFSTDLMQVAVVVTEIENEKMLVAYYVSKKIVSKEILRDFLIARLPHYMVPDFYLQIEKLPLTPNGKIDRKVLANIKKESLVETDFIEATTDTGKRLAEIWQDVLGLKKVGTRNNFFELGGHSLMVAQVINRINQQLKQTITLKHFFANPTIEGITAFLEKNDYVPIPKAPLSNSYPVTPSQKRLWLLSQFPDASLAYNMPLAVFLKGVMDIEKLENAFRFLISRHEILRTKFISESNGEIRQYVLPGDDVKFEFKTENFALYKNADEILTDYLNDQSQRVFDLSKAPLLRISLIKLGEQEHLFYLSMHHIIGDGWSMELLITELVKIYNALLANQKINLPELSIQYKDYALWQQEEMKKENKMAAREFWIKQFSGEIASLDLPGSKKRPLVRTYNGQSRTYHFSVELLNNIKQFAIDNETTLFTILLAGIKTLLYRYTGQTDIVIGMPVAGRQRSELENQVGLYLNTLAIRTPFLQQHTFSEVVKTEKNILLQAFEHQDYPFDELVNDLNIKRDTSRSAIFDIMVMLQNQNQLRSISDREQLAGVRVEQFNYQNNYSQFDLSFRFSEEKTLSLTIEFNTDIYHVSFIDRVFAHLENLFESAIRDPSTGINNIDYLTQLEKQQLLFEFNNTEVDLFK